MKKAKNKQRFVLPAANGQPPEVAPALVAPPALFKLDLGAGTNKREGFLGVDRVAFPGVDRLCDLTQTPWVLRLLKQRVLPDGSLGAPEVVPGDVPLPDNSVEEAHSGHFLEHLTNHEGRWERVRFFNELYRVLVPGGKCTLVIPHWCSNRYYGDPTHKEPFSEMGFYYLLRSWRLGDPAKGVMANAPHADVSVNPDGYSCNFTATWGYSLHPDLLARSADVQQYRLQWYKEAAFDLIATLVKE